MRPSWRGENFTRPLHAEANWPRASDHEVATAFQMGWNELENGELLKTAERHGFELLIICDQNLAYQQNLSARIIAILELWTNHRPTLERHFDFIRTNAESMKPGEYRRLEKPNG